MRNVIKSMSIEEFVKSMRSGLYVPDQLTKRTIRDKNEALLIEVVQSLKDTPEETPHETHLSFIFTAMSMFGDELKHNKFDDEGFKSVFTLSMLSMKYISLSDFRNMFPALQEVISDDEKITLDDFNKRVKELNIDENEYMDLRTIVLIVRYPNKHVQNAMNRYIDIVKYEMGEDVISVILQQIMNSVPDNE